MQDKQEKHPSEPRSGAPLNGAELMARIREIQQAADQIGPLRENTAEEDKAFMDEMWGDK